MESRHVTIRVRYEPRLDYGRSLAWLAPELDGAGLSLTEDHLGDRAPSRTWAGYVDGRTYERFARAWRLPSEQRDCGASWSRRSNGAVIHLHTLDGMNWEVNGESPIIAVTVQVRDRRSDDRFRRPGFRWQAVGAAYDHLSRDPPLDEFEVTTQVIRPEKALTDAGLGGDPDSAGALFHG